MNCKKLSLLTIIWLFFFNTSFAQRQQQDPNQWPSFAVGPLKIQLSGRPGQNVKGAIKLVTRNYKKPANFTIKVMDLGQTSGNSAIPVNFGEGTRFCSDWINIQNEISVIGNEQVEIPFTIQVPREVKGSYFAFINVASKPDRPDGEFVVLVKYRLPVQIELNIPGQALLRINTSDLDYNPHKQLISFRLKNEGFWKTNIEGDIILRHLTSGNQQKIRIPYGPSGNPLVIYPGLEIPLECELSGSLRSGTYSASIRIIMNGFAKTQLHFEFDAGRSLVASGIMKSKEEFDLNIEVFPYLIEMPMRPGAVRHIPLRILNKNKIPVSLDLSIEKADIGIDGNLTYLGSSENFSAIELSDKYLEIESMKTGIIKTKIQIPDKIERVQNNTNVIRITAKRKKENTNQSNGWGSMGEFSIPVLIFDAKSKPAKLYCESFDILPKDKEKNPETGIIRIKNVGEKIGKIKGKMSLKKKEKEYAFLEIGLIRPEIILPGKEREFRFEIPPLDGGEFTLSTKIYFDEKQRDIALFAEKSFNVSAIMPEALR